MRIDGTLAALVAGFVLLLVLGGSDFILFQRNRINSRKVEATLRTELLISNMTSLVGQAESAQRGFLLTHDPTYAQPFETAATAIPGRLDDLAAAVATDPEQAQRVVQLRQRVEAKVAEMQRVLDVDRTLGRDQGIEAVRTHIGRDLMTEITQLLTDATRHEQSVLTERFSRSREDDGLTLTLDALAIAVIVLLAATTLVRVRRALVEAGASRAALAATNDNLELIVATRTSDLREANEEIQRFAYIVSHDLRSPLVNVMGFTSELESGLRVVDAYLAHAPADLPEDVRIAIREEFPEAIGFIRSSTGRMDKLISAILRISREGRRTFTAERIDMTALVTGIADGLQHSATEAEARITVRPLPSLVTDRLALEQIFANLLENALKYLKPGRAGIIEVRGRAEGDHAVFEVVDNGRGIASEDYPRVFELFRRAGPQDRPGEGIGLAHVRTLARALGGSIDCASRLDEGTTFRLSLPMQKAREGSVIA